MADPLTVDEIVENVRRLSTRDRLRVIERIAVDAEEDLDEPKRVGASPSQWGVWAHLGPAPSEEEIREVRREMWANFPREDV